MQSQERDLIEGLFNRLKIYETQPRDPEAERLIASLVAGQPGAPYLLTQTVLVQEHALQAAQGRIAELEAKVGAMPAQQPGFLESAPRIGPWGAAPSTAAPSTAAPASAPPAAAPRSPLQAAVAGQPSAGGGFLQSALATAAGVAGGALLFDGIRSLFAHTGSPFGAYGDPNTSAADASSPLMTPDQISSADLAQDDGAADNYDTPSDDSSGDDGDDFGDDDSPFDSSDEV